MWRVYLDLYHTPINHIIEPVIVVARAEQKGQFTLLVKIVDYTIRQKQAESGYEGCYIGTYFDYIGDANRITKILRLWVSRLHFCDDKIEIKRAENINPAEFLVIKYDPLFAAIYEMLKIDSEVILVLKNKKRYVLAGLWVFGMEEFSIKSELFYFRDVDLVAFYRKLVFEPFSMLHKCEYDRDENSVGLLAEILTHGLESKKHFAKFLTKGLYDPRLWLFVFSFIEDSK